MRMIDVSRVYAAHIDSWQAQGRLREPFGGGVASFVGWRLMASGLPFPPHNAGCVTDVRAADPEQARAWYLARGAGWGILVPSGSRWPHGRLLVTQSLMAVDAGSFSEVADPPPGLSLRRGTAASKDVEAAVTVDGAAFGSDKHGSRAWLEPLCGSELAEVVIGELEGIPVATGYALRCTGEAGPTVYLGGVAVLPAARKRGIAAALSSWLLARGFDEGASFAHLQTVSEGAARVYSRLGFEEFGGVDIYSGT